MGGATERVGVDEEEEGLEVRPPLSPRLPACARAARLDRSGEERLGT
jgi:hypothetical protein